MIINILTLFPDFFKTALDVSILKRAQEKELVQFNMVNIRDFATDKHQITDDRPFGGGPGMVMKIEPIDKALEFVKKQAIGEKGAGQKVTGQATNSKIILTSAKGKLFNQALAQEYTMLDQITIICGHYGGVDKRVANHLVDEEIRIGDYVLTGGEPASLVMVDSIVRLIPGVLGNKKSIKDESHNKPGQLAAPQYTRPKVYKDWTVPEVLLSGNHEKIKQWRESNLSF